MSETLDILGVCITVTDLKEACQKIDQWISQKTKTYVCVAPVASVMEAQDDGRFKEIINQASMVTPDGMPLVWTGRLKGKKSIGRTYGPDLMLALCEKGEHKGYRHFIYGADEQTNQKLINNLKSRYAKIDIVGEYAPPFRDKDEPEERAVLDKMNEASADILWVGLGSPKQEYWMANHRDKLNVPVMIGVGAAFDFHAGTKRQAPEWMRNIGLEWLFRLCCEPKRLWKRYIVGNTRFIILSIASIFKRNKKIEVDHEA